MKTARMSVFSKGDQDYACQYEWPEEGCFCQCGDRGIVFTPKGSYNTAFFEAFPRNPNTFIRGEGATIAAAEEDAWKQYQKILTCPGPNGHEFEARGYESGCGLCKHCDLFMSGVIPPIHACPGCGKLNWGLKDINGDFWCDDCREGVPDSLLDEIEIHMRKYLRDAKAEMAEYEKAQAEKADPEQGVSGAT